tara:strand:- start:689 stop:1537 length:849 start_codon:yes stop_codon:yes gene_type:complete
MGELQEGGIGITYDSDDQDDVSEQEVLADVAEESELAPDSPDEGEQNTDLIGATVDGVKIEGPDGFKKAIDKQHRKYREEQRARQALEVRLKEFESKQAPAVESVTVPPLPDSWDEDYDQKMRDRDAAMVRKANEDYQKQRDKEQQRTDQQRVERESYENQQAQQTKFVDAGKKLGVDAAALSKAEDSLVKAGVGGYLASEILDDADGPLIALYLEANELEMYDLIDISKANPIKAGAFLSSIKAKAASLRKKSSNAPPPADRLDGKAAAKKDRGPSGATYD